MRIVALACVMPLLTRLAYKPVGIILGMFGGRMAGKAYTRVWSAIAREENSPSVMDRDSGWGEVVSAAVVKAVVFAGVKTLVDRAGATAFERVTGTWPGKAGSKTET
jgi:uncharacterized protein DUF4235